MGLRQVIINSMWMINHINLLLYIISPAFFSDLTLSFLFKISWFTPHVLAYHVGYWRKYNRGLKLYRLEKNKTNIQINSKFNEKINK